MSAQMNLQFDGFCDRAFPEVEKLLELPPALTGIRIVTAKKTTAAKYANFTDFLYAELVPDWRAACLAFYEGRGKALRLRTDVSDEQLRYWDQLLRRAITYAQLLTGGKSYYSWRQYLLQFLRSLDEMPIGRRDEQRPQTAQCGDCGSYVPSNAARCPECAAGRLVGT